MMPIFASDATAIFSPIASTDWFTDGLTAAHSAPMDPLYADPAGVKTFTYHRRGSGNRRSRNSTNGENARKDGKDKSSDLRTRKIRIWNSISLFCAESRGHTNRAHTRFDGPVFDANANERRDHLSSPKVVSRVRSRTRENLRVFVVIR